MVASSASFTAPHHYDEDLAPFTFVPFARALVDRLPAGMPGPVLEVACGTGVLTRELRARLPASVELVATDLSAAMLAYARGRLQDAPRIHWQEADAMQLPFGPGSFRSVACGFGFMFAPDPQHAVAEARRVLEGGGRLFFSVWDRIEENPHGLANADVIEALFPDDPQMKFRLPYAMHDEGRLGAMLHQAGFGKVRIERRRIPFNGADPYRLARGQIRGTPRSALLLERGVPLEQVIDAVAALLASRGGNPYAGYAQALLVEAEAL